MSPRHQVPEGRAERHPRPSPRTEGDGPEGGAVRMGLLGSADIARRRMLPALAELGSARLVAVASRSAERAADLAARFGCEAVDGYASLLARDDIDAVYVPLPPALHHEWVLAALRAGKHVLAEKPLATTLAQAAELVATAERGGLVLMENFLFLHHSQHAAVARLVRDGAIGEPRTFFGAFGIPPLDRASPRYRPDLGGGSLLDVGVYPLRAAQLHLGGALEVLGGRLRTDAASGVDVAGSVLLGAERGVTAQLDFGFEHGYRSVYGFWGSEGHLTVTRAFTPPRDHRPVLRIEREGRVSAHVLDADDQVRNTLAAFATAVRSPAARPSAGPMLEHAELLHRVRGAVAGGAP